MTNRTRAPIIQQQELTVACNNSCGFCYNPGQHPPAVKLSEAQRRRNLESAALSVAKGVLAACLTGGEPLLDTEHLYEILTIYQRAGCYVSLNTNGRLLNEYVADRLAALGLNSALISLHGPEEQHNKMVGAAHAFGETWNGLITLQASGIRVMPNFVATAQNLAGLPEVGERLLTAGFSAMTVTPFLPSWLKPAHRQFILSEYHYRDYFQTLAQLYRRGMCIDSTLPVPPCMLLKLFPRDWRQFVRVHTPRVCMAGRSFGAISPQGKMRACIQAPDLPEFGGPVLGQYEASWARSGRWAQPDLLPALCLECQALEICGGGCRTGCLWQNQGRPRGKTMDMGDPLTAEQAGPFFSRVEHQPVEVASSHFYRWQPDIRFRPESWGAIVFNPRKQAFTALAGSAPELEETRKGTFKITSSKLAGVLLSLEALEVCHRPQGETITLPESITVLPANTLLPRLARGLLSLEKIYGLRADTGERYFF